MNRIYICTVTFLAFGGFLTIDAFPKKEFILKNAKETDHELQATIAQLEQTRQPLHSFQSLLFAAERNVQKKLLLIEHELQRFNVSKKPHETYYQSLTFTQVLNLVLKNLRAQGQTKLADQIQELALYVIGLERIKASGAYSGTEMERTLDRNIYENKKKLVDIINSLIRT